MYIHIADRSFYIPMSATMIEVSATITATVDTAYLAALTDPRRS